MESLILLIPIALFLIGLAVAFFLWAVNNEQFDDLEGPAYAILFDDEQPVGPLIAPHSPCSSPCPSHDLQQDSQHKESQYD